jgi:2-hydroxychromene-2-carboxylate isomerase
MAWPIDIEPWWEVPHLAWLEARRGGQEQTLYRALIAARWERGENICDPQVLARVATSAGLDGAALAGACNDPDIRRDGTDVLVRAWRDDVFGIPFFITGRQKFWGLDRVEAFVSELTGSSRALSAPDAAVPVGVADGPPLDRDTAGGCG